MNHFRIAKTLGFVNVGLATFVIMLLVLPPSAVTANSFPIPPHMDPCVHVMTTGPCVTPPPPSPRDPYCLFPGQGKHLGFGNGFGRAGAKFLCDVISAL